jgi:hypothetical protein
MACVSLPPVRCLRNIFSVRAQPADSYLKNNIATRRAEHGNAALATPSLWQAPIHHLALPSVTEQIGWVSEL